VRAHLARESNTKDKYENDLERSFYLPSRAGINQICHGAKGATDIHRDESIARKIVWKINPKMTDDTIRPSIAH